MKKLEIDKKLKGLVKEESRIKIEILNYLELIEKRKVFLDLGYTTLFDYARKALGYTDSQAQRRISAMRTLRRHPTWKEKVKKGCITPSQVNLLGKIELNLKRDGQAVTPILDSLLPELENKSVKDSELLLQEKLNIPIKRKITLEVDEETYQEWKIYRNTHYNLTPEKLIKNLLNAQLNQRNKPVTIRKTTQSTRSPSKNVNLFLKQRANFKCEYPSCSNQLNLQVDHIIPWYLGGKTEINNLRIYCQAHNLQRNLRRE